MVVKAKMVPRTIAILLLVLLQNRETSAKKTICQSYGGECKYKSCGSSGLRVRGEKAFCDRWSDICCAYPSGGVDMIDKHLEQVEQFWVRGYQPTSGSGVTIASGYDIGYGTDVSGCTGRALWSKLKPYRCCRSKASLARHGLKARDLRLNVVEAYKIDTCTKQINLKKMAKYLKGVTQCGQAVLVSLKHWCGLAGITGRDPYHKCQAKRKGASGGSGDFIWQCISQGSRCTDKKLYAALNQLLAMQRQLGRKGFRINRLLGEIQFLKNCSPIGAL